MENIKVLNINRINSSVEFQVRFTLELPNTLKGVEGKLNIAQTYSGKYGITLIDDVEYFTFTDVFAFSKTDSLALIKATLIGNYNGVKTTLNSFTLQEYDNLLNLHFDGENWV